MTDSDSDMTVAEKFGDKIVEELSKENAPNQADLADELGIAQSTVSEIWRSHKRGLERGREEGRTEGFSDGFDRGFERAKSFAESDETENEDAEEYWCNFCENDPDVNGRVYVEYLADECPNGHDLTGEWPE